MKTCCHFQVARGINSKVLSIRVERLLPRCAVRQSQVSLGRTKFVPRRRSPHAPLPWLVPHLHPHRLRPPSLCHPRPPPCHPRPDRQDARRRRCRRRAVACGAVGDVRAVRERSAACGDFVPLVAEVAVEPSRGYGDGAERGVRVRLHDPYRLALPLVGGVRMDDPEAESGRGLPIIDLLAPGWRVAKTPVGKQARCRIPGEGDVGV